MQDAVDEYNNDNTYGFFLLRHVNSELTNHYWIECYKCIRKFYPNQQIVIIDDDSNPLFLKNDYPLTNTILIDSEFKKRGEIYLTIII